jgi:hypothetical protein
MASTFAETILALESARQALQKNADLVPSVGKFAAPLDAVIARVQTLTAAQKTLIADKQKTTQDLNAALHEGRNLLRDIRAMVRGEIGSRSEKLVEFGVAPLRKRVRRGKPAETPEEPATRKTRAPESA